jgi:transposase
MSPLPRGADTRFTNGNHEENLVIEVAVKRADLMDLRRLARGRTVAARVAFRSRIVLLAAQGFTDSHIARQLGTTVKTVHRWRVRYVESGLNALGRDAPGRGRKRSIPSELVAAVIAAKRHADRRAEKRSYRQLAGEFGVSPATISRILARARHECSIENSSRTQL